MRSRQLKFVFAASPQGGGESGPSDVSAGRDFLLHIANSRTASDLGARAADASRLTGLWAYNCSACENEAQRAGCVTHKAGSERGPGAKAPGPTRPRVERSETRAGPYRSFTEETLHELIDSASEFRSCKATPHMISLLHRFVAIPAIYDLSQRLAGGRRFGERLAAALADLPVGSRVLDVGAGTGLAKKAFPTGCTYAACEPDPQKCAGLLRVCPEEAVMRACATEIPTGNESFDACLMSAVAHHLSDQEFAAALREVQRVLTTDGTFFLADPLWVPQSFRGRLLWAMDRGSHPRTLAQLLDAVQECFSVEQTILWSIHHYYAIIICRPK